MGKPKSVWVIEDGDYSAYWVIGVFSSQENAAMVQAKSGGEIAKWPLNPSVDKLQQGMSLFNFAWLESKFWEAQVETVERCAIEIESRLEKHGEVWENAEQACMALANYVRKLSLDPNWAERERLKARLEEATMWDASQWGHERIAELERQIAALLKRKAQ